MIISFLTIKTSAFFWISDKKIVAKKYFLASVEQRSYKAIAYRSWQTYHLSPIAYRGKLGFLSSIVYRLSQNLSSIAYRLSVNLSSIVYHKTYRLSSIMIYFAFPHQVCGKWKYALLSDLSTFFKVPPNALKTFIWPLLVSVKLHFPFKVRGMCKYAVLSDFSTFFNVPPNALKTFIWPLLVSVRLYFAFKVRGIFNVRVHPRL